MKIMNKILICIPTYNRNTSLINCLKSIKNLKNSNFSKINILIIDNTTTNNSYGPIKKFKERSTLKIYHRHEKKRGIVFARNKCLLFARKLKPNYIAFIDDDCKVDKNWLKNIFELLNKVDADVITGPQLYEGGIKKNYMHLFEKKYTKKLLRVAWAASNNVFFKFNILEREKNIKFDKNLNKFGMGEDQLFFSIISRIGYKVYWSQKVIVTEKMHAHRSNIDWIKERSKRLGILGHYLDIKMHGKIIGYFINYIKSIYFFFLSIIIYINIFNLNRKLDLANFIFRFYGKLIGPFQFKKIQFFK